jgi:hypothetical protein
MRAVTSCGLTSLAAILMLGAAAPVQAGGPSGCDDISAIAPFTQFRYTQIQTIFDTLTDPKNPFSQLCSSCHPGNIGSGSLGLGDGFSYANLVGVPSAQNPAILRVSPGNPMSSLLFQKINCDVPEVGGRMPPGGMISITQQAFFYDWIRLGAPLSRLGFEDR